MLQLLLAILKVKKTENLNKEQIAVIRKKRFNKLLEHVLQNSKFYREHYRKAGITLENFDKIEQKDIPTIDKQMMMDNYDDFVCKPELKRKDLEDFIADPINKGKKYLNEYEIIHTSGSSGKIGIFAYNKKDWATLMALVITRITKSKINPFKKNKVAFIGAIDGHFAGIRLAESAPNFLFEILPISINSPLAEINKKINDFQPDVLTGYASGTYLIADQQLNGKIDIHPKKILCSGDTLTPLMKDTIKKAFGVEPVNYYASSESVGMAAECDIHKGLHMFDDWHCFEIVDKNYNSVAPGKPGKLLLTNLYNYTQPLIRYEMSDELILSSYPCQCGWSFPILESMAGRQEEYVWFENNKGKKDFIHPIILAEFFVPGIEKFQFIQKDKNTLIMKVMISGDEDTVVINIQKEMNDILQKKELDKSIQFNVEVVKEIYNDPKTGKFKFIIPLK